MIGLLQPGSFALPNTRLKFLDGLRGIAALMVVIYHLASRTSAAWLTSKGYLGVGIFFALSGFVIASVIGDRRISFGYLGRFVARRAVRLDLPYWFNILAVMALGILAIHAGRPTRAYSWRQFWPHLIYLQEIVGVREINPAYWTLCFEIQFYMTLILVLWVAQALGGSLRSHRFQVAFLVLIAISVIFSKDLLPTPRGLMLSYWWAFALGALTWWTVSERITPLYWVAASLLILSQCTGAHADWRITGVLTALAIFAACAHGSMLTWLSNPVTQFLGRISYSLYLSIGGWEMQSLALRYVNQYVALAVGVGTSILSAWLCYRLIERPAITLSRRIRTEGAGPSWPVAVASAP